MRCGPTSRSAHASAFSTASTPLGRSRERSSQPSCLLPEVGLRKTVYAGAAANFIVFAAAALLARYMPPPARFGPTPRGAEHALAAMHWILPLIAISGMISFVYEVLWTRLLGYVLGGSTAAFATMLASFLLGNRSRQRPGLARSEAVARAAGIGFASGPARNRRWPRGVRSGWRIGCRVSPPRWGPHRSNLVPGGLTAVADPAARSRSVSAPPSPSPSACSPQHAEEAAPASARVYAWNTAGLDRRGGGGWLLSAARTWLRGDRARGCALQSGAGR